MQQISLVSWHTGPWGENRPCAELSIARKHAHAPTPARTKDPAVLKILRVISLLRAVNLLLHCDLLSRRTLCSRHSFCWNHGHFSSPRKVRSAINMGGVVKTLRCSNPLFLLLSSYFSTEGSFGHARTHAHARARTRTNTHEQAHARTRTNKHIRPPVRSTRTRTHTQQHVRTHERTQANMHPHTHTHTHSNRQARTHACTQESENASKESKKRDRGRKRGLTRAARKWRERERERAHNAARGRCWIPWQPHGSREKIERRAHPTQPGPASTGKKCGANYHLSPFYRDLGNSSSLLFVQWTGSLHKHKIMPNTMVLWNFLTFRTVKARHSNLQ